MKWVLAFVGNVISESLSLSPKNEIMESSDNKKSNLPAFMKAAQGKDYGSIDEMISVEDGVAVPRLSDLPPKKRKDFIVIKTHAVALAPGDCRVISGLTRELQGPPEFPYIPGGDACGMVVEMPESTSDKLPLAVGDRVAARFVGKPMGALGEYAFANIAVCDKVDSDDISSDEAAALASACPSVLIADRCKGSRRVLVFGAGGGEGAHVCQLLRKEHNVKHIVAVTSTNPQRMVKEPYNCDSVHDYTKEDVFNIEEYQNNPFDTIVDLGGGAWPKIISQTRKKSIIQPASKGGRFITTTPDSAIFEIHSMLGVLKMFLFTPLYRAVSSRMWLRNKIPKYTFAMSLPEERSVITRTLKLAANKTLKGAVDPRGPFPFTTQGVRDAFNLLNSRHPQGKVVIRVSE